MDFLKKFIEVFYKKNAFDEIVEKNYILPALLTFIFSITLFNILKISIGYDKYKEIMVNQMEQNLEEIKENLKKQDLTPDEREQRLENYRKVYLTTISLPLIVLTFIASGIFLQPISVFIQAFAFSSLFILFPKLNLQYSFRKLLLILIYSKSAIILGTFLTLIFSIIFQNPMFSFSLTNLIPYELVLNNNYLKLLKSTLYHIEPFSILSLVLLSIGLNRVFNFPVKNAFSGVFGIYFVFLISNYIFFLLFFK